MVVQYFKKIGMRTIEFVQLLEKTVHFGTNTIVNENKNQGQCTKNIQLFSLVVQPFNGSTAFRNIHMRTTSFVQLLEKTVHFGTNTIVNEIKSQGQCTKDVQHFSLVVQLLNGCTAFSKYTYGDHRICTALEKTVHFTPKTIVNEIKSKGQCKKRFTTFLFGSTAFQSFMYSFLKIYI